MCTNPPLNALCQSDHESWQSWQDEASRVGRTPLREREGNLYFGLRSQLETRSWGADCIAGRQPQAIQIHTRGAFSNPRRQSL